MKTRHTLVATAAMALFGRAALATPAGGTVVAGAATLTNGPGTLTVRQTSNNAIIDWRSFNVRAGELAQFVLPSSSSAILNRVTGGDAALVQGQLQSNGRVFVIDPNGVLVGDGAVIRTGAFVASTRDVSNAQFMAGGPMQFSGTSQGSVVNLGTIRAESGDVALIGWQVSNAGTIQAPHGAASLAAGRTVLLSPGTDPRVLLQAGLDGAKVEAGGVIQAAQAELVAAGGNPWALAVNVSGSVTATGVGGQGGLVRVDSDGGTNVSGQLAATRGDTGGEVRVTGSQVTLAATARLDASGANAGGTILVGGGAHGQDASLRNATTTTVDAGATLRADATRRGHGGTVVVWADGTTTYQGAISARGGAAGGDGGNAEVSGHQRLAFHGTADLRAASSAPGRTGTLLLDPTDVTITDGPAKGNLNVSGNTSVLTDADIQNALATANVTIKTTSSGTGNGDVTFAVTTNPAGHLYTTDNTLYVMADRDVVVNSTVTMDGATGSGGNLSLQAGRNVVINNPTPGPGTDVSLFTGGSITLVADAKDNGAGTGTITLAPGVSVRSNLLRLFVPTQASLVTDPSSQLVDFNLYPAPLPVVPAKWVGDAGTDGSGVYLAAGRQAPPPPPSSSGTVPGGLTPGQAIQLFPTDGPGIFYVDGQDSLLVQARESGDQTLAVEANNVQALDDWLSSHPDDTAAKATRDALRNDVEIRLAAELSDSLLGAWQGVQDLWGRLPSDPDLFDLANPGWQLNNELTHLKNIDQPGWESPDGASSFSLSGPTAASKLSYSRAAWIKVETAVDQMRATLQAAIDKAQATVAAQQAAYDEAMRQASVTRLGIVTTFDGGDINAGMARQAMLDQLNAQKAREALLLQIASQLDAMRSQIGFMP